MIPIDAIDNIRYADLPAPTSDIEIGEPQESSVEQSRKIADVFYALIDDISFKDIKPGTEIRKDLSAADFLEYLRDRKISEDLIEYLVVTDENGEILTNAEFTAYATVTVGDFGEVDIAINIEHEASAYAPAGTSNNDTPVILPAFPQPNKNYFRRSLHINARGSQAFGGTMQLRGSYTRIDQPDPLKNPVGIQILFGRPDQGYTYWTDIQSDPQSRKFVGSGTSTMKQPNTIELSLSAFSEELQDIADDIAAQTLRGFQDQSN